MSPRQQQKRRMTKKMMMDMTINPSTMITTTHHSDAADCDNSGLSDANRTTKYSRVILLDWKCNVITVLQRIDAEAYRIPHLEMCACDCSKSRHVTFTKSGYFPHEAILPLYDIGVGNGGQIGTCPPPKKNGGKYFSGNYYVKFGHFSAKNHAKFGNFC